MNRQTCGCGFANVTIPVSGDGSDEPLIESSSGKRHGLGLHAAKTEYEIIRHRSSG